MRAGNPQSWEIPLSGPLFEGTCVRIGWPDGDEIDLITALRNRPAMRKHFLDSRPLDVARNHEWLLRGMNRPYEAMLAIRMKDDDAFVGAIGWSRGDPAERSVELGRVMVDARKAVRYRASMPDSYGGIALDAGGAVRDFAFSVMQLDIIRMEVIAGNALSLAAATAGGGRIVGSKVSTDAIGRPVQLLCLECRRDDWLPRWHQDSRHRVNRAPIARTAAGARR